MSAQAELVAFRVLQHHRVVVDPRRVQDAQHGRARAGQSSNPAGGSMSL